MQFEIKIAGDSALNLVFSNEINEDVSSSIRLAADKLESEELPAVVEVVPTFCSMMVYYNPTIMRLDEMCNVLREKLRGVVEEKVKLKRVIHIPVCYGGEYGPDIEFVASNAGMSVGDVVDIHTSSDYLIDMLGFLPGFAYLGGLDERLHTPRLEVPRTTIPAGSVGIGGSQTGVYPLASPGGWRLIGRTPLKPYDPHKEPAVLYKAGDYLHFDSISENEYLAIESKVLTDSYECKIEVEEV